MDVTAHPAFSEGLSSFLPPSVTALWPTIRVPPPRGCLKTISLIYIVFTDAENYSSPKAMWTCALQRVQIRSGFEDLTWLFLSVCPSISVHYCARPENFQHNYSLLTGEISSVVISDYFYHMPFLNADMFSLTQYWSETCWAFGSKI